MRILILALTLLNFVMVQPLLADDTAAIKKLVSEKIEVVIGLLRNTKMAKETRNTKIIEALDPIFDFPRMAKLSLGKKGWVAMNEAQQKEFLDLFILRLKESYLEKLDLYTDEEVKVDEAEQIKGNRVNVKTYLVSKTDKMEMIYKFYQSDSAWMVYDVEILGVSIVQTYRSQFEGILANQSPEALLAKMREKGGLKIPDKK